MVSWFCVALFPIGAVAVIIAVVVGYIYFGVKYCKKVRTRLKKEGKPPSVAFFHPYCNAGGGGERVLWCAVKAVQTRFPSWKVVVYTGDLNASPEAIIKKVRQTFNISLEEDVQFIYLHQRRWLEADRYPYFTLLGQAIGSVVLGIEALIAFLPDIYIDTMGWSFTLPLFAYIGGCTTACYIHYPTISTDMLRRVVSREVTLTNKARVARSPFLSFSKFVYYRLFASMYSWAGSFSNTIMVNSSWTEDHINTIWRCCASGAKATYRIYPPCDTSALKAMPLAPDICKMNNSLKYFDPISINFNDHMWWSQGSFLCPTWLCIFPFVLAEGGPIKILSIGQFRPEKNHPLQLKSMYELRQLVSETIWDRVKLVIIGSCRGSEDQQRVKDMNDFCRHLSLENNVEFKVNISYKELKQELGSSVIGLHAMYNEHFGIGVVECMAAGHIMVANRSGGPKADIIEESEGSRNGYLALDETEYARAFATIIKLSPAVRTRIREAARSSVDRFSTQEFEKNFLQTVEPMFSQIV